MDELTRAVMDVARRHLEAEDVSALNDPDDDLSALIPGSLAVVGFMLDLESTLSFKFPADKIDAETFRSVRTVADTIRALRGTGAR